MKFVKEYLCDHTPTDDEIKESIEIVDNNDCVVKLKWFVRYNGWYRLYIKKGMTFEDCKNKLPKVYGL